jgi:hypothetical protein
LRIRAKLVSAERASSFVVRVRREFLRVIRGILVGLTKIKRFFFEERRHVCAIEIREEENFIDLCVRLLLVYEDDNLFVVVVVVVVFASFEISCCFVSEEIYRR